MDIIKVLNRYRPIERLFPHTPVIIGLRGSVAHGLYVPPAEPTSIDDIDLMGVCLAPINTYLGLHNFEGREFKYGVQNELDIVVYELRKYVQLLLKSNPNVITLLWLKPEHYFYVSNVGIELIANRQRFISKRIYPAFLGYSYGQLKRMTHLAYNGRMGEKRKQLVDKFGYDCKNACHLIRLLRMGIEALNTGEFNVFRKDDAEELLQIKRGEWSLEKIHETADALLAEAEDAADRSCLPKDPETHWAENFLVRTLYEHCHNELTVNW